MSVYPALLRPLLFRASPDHGHALAHAALRWSAPWRALGAAAGLMVGDPRLRVRFAGIELPNPVGLAAGFDKNCELVGALSHLGFGFVTVGSIMPEPRYGNPFPRLVRYPEKRSLADSMGVPSKGLAYAVERLARPIPRPVPVIANVGGFTAAAIAENVLAVEPHVDAVEISLMCPNVLKDGERFDELRLLRDVLERVERRRKPAIVRVPNDTARSEERLGALIEIAVAGGVAGLKVGGGSPVAEPLLGTGRGTLHGRAIFETALQNVERAARLARGRLPIKGNGGVFEAGDVLRMLRAGACCVDLYSAFIYEGWRIARTINEDLVAMLDRGAAPSLGALVPA